MNTLRCLGLLLLCLSSVVLAETTVFEARVLDADTGAPIPGAWVRVIPLSPEGCAEERTVSHGTYYGQSDDSGTVRLEDVEVICRLEAGADGYHEWYLDTPDPDSQVWTIELQPIRNTGASMSGIVKSSPYGQKIPFAVVKLLGTDLCAITDENGTYTLTDIIPAKYDIQCLASGYQEFTYNEIPFLEGMKRTINFDLEWSLAPDDPIIRITVEKPNIYLYPEETTAVSVRLELPAGATLTESDPPYGAGWDVTVTPEGRIDGAYDYLFYEADVPALTVPETGWTVPTGELETFFRGNLAEFGFVGREIEDFIEWWIPRLTDAPAYAIRPLVDEQVNDWYSLMIEPRPEHLRRLVYVISPAMVLSSTSPEEPLIEPFTRQGFTAVEWGVVLLDDAGDVLLR